MFIGLFGDEVKKKETLDYLTSIGFKHSDFSPVQIRKTGTREKRARKSDPMDAFSRNAASAANQRFVLTGLDAKTAEQVKAEFGLDAIYLEPDLRAKYQAEVRAGRMKGKPYSVFVGEERKKALPYVPEDAESITYENPRELRDRLEKIIHAP